MKISVLYVICFCIGSYVAGSKDLCDVRIWYQNLIADDIFIRDLDRDQIKLRNNIESLVLKGSETETSRMIDCYIIEMYNEMLQEKYEYVYNLNIRGDATQVEEQIPTEKGTDQNLGQNESTNNAKEETAGAEQASAEKGKNETERAKDRTHYIVTEKEAQQKADEYDRSGDASEIDETELFEEDEEMEFSKQDADSGPEVENDAQKSGVNLGEPTIQEPLVLSTQKETSQVLSTDVGSEKLNITAPGEPNEPKADTVLDGVKLGKRSTSGMSYGVCRKRYSTRIDIFDALCCDNSTAKSNKSSQKQPSDRLPSLSSCHNDLFCSNKCFYVFSPAYCIVGYLSWIKKYDTNAEGGQLDAAKLSEQGPIQPDSIAGKLESSAEGTLISEQREDEEKAGKSLHEARDEDQIKVREVLTDISTHEPKVQKETHFSIKKDSLSLEEIELHMNKKTSEYGSKLQNLELMILRLENQLLLEKMNKQNHSSTITRLENQILTLENILLNMNKKYSDILSESQGMKARQMKYLELEQERKKDTYLALEDKSAKNFEIITQHQAKIIELTEKLENQTEIISNLKGRSDYLEDHNRMLHQLIMNQTMFMSQIMQRVQDLSDQNSQQREETSLLKQKLDMSLARNKLQELKQKISASGMSERFMEQLETLVSDTKIPIFNKKSVTEHELEGNVKNDDDDDADVHFKDYLNGGSFYEQIIDWCPAENYTAPACMFNALFNTQCPPYSNFIWRKCTGKVTQQNISKTSDSVLDKDEGQRVDNRESTTADDSDKDLQERLKEEDNKLSANNEPIDATKADDEQVLRMPVDSKADDEQVLRMPVDSKAEYKDKITTTGDGEDNNSSSKVEDQAKINSPDEKSSKDESEEHMQHVEQHEPADKNANRLDVLEQKNKDASKEDDNTGTQQKPEEQEQDSSKGKTTAKGGKATKAEAKKERKTPIYMPDEKQREPKDCYDYYIRGNYKDGTYKIKPIGSDELIPVFCDMKRGGWTVIQKRQDGSTNFFRNWEDYKKGFGGLYGEHWLGNENIHRLTMQDYYSLRVDLRDWDKEWRYASYEYFLVESEDEGYRLNIDGYSGDAGDGLGKHDGSQFSTKDVDNDKVVKEFGGSCANRFHGAGWYYKCYSSNLNGKYYTSGTIPDKQFDGITWKPWKGPSYSLRVTEMKMRPASVKDVK